MKSHFDVEAIGTGVLRWTAHGYVDVPLQTAVQRDAERLLERMDAEVGAILDMRAMFAFAPGTPMRGLRWAQAHADRIPRWVVLSTSRTVSAIVLAMFPILAPTLTFSMADDEAGAMSQLARPEVSTPRERRHTGPRRIDSASETERVRKTGRRF